jgi:SNF2 family DNA or RNA helicase
MLKSPWDLIVFDESHRIKGYNSVTSKHLAKVKAEYRLALTGTAMPHSPLDIFGQYRALDVGVFGSNYTSFKHQYALWSGYEDHQFDGMNPLRLDEFNHKVYSIAFRVEAGDVLDLPPVLPDQQLFVALEGAQDKAYRDIEKEMHAEFPGLIISKLAEALVNGESTSQNKLAQMIRLRQLTGGALNDNEGRSVIIGEAKAGLLKDYLIDFPVDEPIVVFCAFVPDLDVVKRVVEKIGRRYGEVSGRRDDLTADSEYPPDVDVLAVQIAAGGSGVDLTRSCYGCYYSKDYSLGNYKQSRARLDRPGQTRPVRFSHLTAMDTIDEDVDTALFERQELIDVVQDPKHQKKAE